MGVIRTKLIPPIEPRSLIDRQHLLDRLEQAEGRRLTLVLAPAGYGKTSLLAQWYRKLRTSGRACGWLTADGNDTDAAGFLLYIADALSEAGIAFEPGLDRVLRTDAFPSAEFLIEIITNALDRNEFAAHLFIDDAHLLAPDAARALARLIEYAPSSTAFITAARSMPDLQLARIRARGQLLELQAKDLKLTLDEVRRFVASNAGAVLDDVEIATLEKRTEGWVTGVKLASMALHRSLASRQESTSLTGSNRSVADFFTEEVFSVQPPNIRQFLLQTSILDRFCPALCEAVTGLPNARQLLQEVDEKGLFLLHLDEESNWHRYHHLFVEFLKRRMGELGPDSERDLHLRASQWFWDADLPVEAIAHALKAGAPLLAADFLERRCHELTYGGKLRLVSGFVSKIPEDALKKYPGILLTMAWLKTRALQLEDAAALIRAAAARLDEIEAAKGMPNHELRRLRYQLLHREMVLAAASDDMNETELRCERLLNEYSEEQHPYLKGTIYGHMLAARRQKYRFDDVDRIAAAAQGTLRRSVYSAAAVGLQATLGPILFQMGKTAKARETLEQGRDEAIRYSGLRSSVTSVCALPLAEVVYESNELNYAQQLIDESWQSILEIGFVDQLQSAFVMRARLCSAKDDMAAALGFLDEGMAIAVERRLDRLAAAITGERVRLLVAANEPEEASRYARSTGLSTTRPPLPASGVVLRDELVALIWVRIALARGRHLDGIAIARAWRKFCAARHALRSQVRWNLLLVQLHMMSGNPQLAQRSLQEALTHGAKAGMIRSFVDDGAIIQTLLESNVRAELQAGCPADPFMAELLRAFAGTSLEPRMELLVDSDEVMFGSLNAKEREILSFLAAGLRNREIATRLGTTEGTIKWYLQKIYDKIGIHRRQHAVDRARKFGLIAS